MRVEVRKRLQAQRRAEPHNEMQRRLRQQPPTQSRRFSVYLHFDLKEAFRM